AEIDQLIRETISETDAAVKNMETSTKEVASGKELIANAGNTLEEIQQASDNVSTMLQEISASSQQMAAGAKQVTKSVEEVAAISEQAFSSTEQASASAQQILATVQEAASSAQSLSEMGIDLNTMVTKFKTGDGATAKPMSISKNRQGKSMSKRLAEAKKKMDENIHSKSHETKEKVAVGYEYTDEGGYIND
ncbi:MAG: methyl-accepting chemotaxis protein, partial [Planctomycetota bacterium]